MPVFRCSAGGHASTGEHPVVLASEFGNEWFYALFWLIPLAGMIVGARYLDKRRAAQNDLRLRVERLEAQVGTSDEA